MDYNIFKKDVDLLKSLFEKIQKQSDKSDSVLFQQKLEELDKYLNDTDNTGVYKELLDIKFHITLMGMLRLFFSRSELNLVRQLAKILSTLTEYSELFSEALVKEDMPDLLISVTIKCGDSNFLSQNPTTIDNIIYYILHVTYHIIRHARFHQCFLLHKSINQFKETIHPWLSSKVVNTRILVTFIMVWLMKEDSEDKDMIVKHSDVIKHVCDYIKVLTTTHEKVYRGYSLWELLFGVQALTSIDSIKTEIINVSGFMQTLITIINSDLSESKEIETSLGILWSLTFVEKNREILKEKYHIEDVIKDLSKSKNTAISKKIKGILWELNKKRKVNADKKDVKYDVFISYSHVQKDPIAKLATLLKTRFKVWIDSDNIKGSGLNDMANGIEQSEIFIMAVSSSYKQSQCCRSEANWAFKLNKPIIPLIMVHKYSPDGWLGMMISSETYIDFSDQSNFQEASDKIIKHISYKCSQLSQQNEPIDGDIERKEEEADHFKTTSSGLPHNVREWNTGHVTVWLTDHKLSHFQSKFVDFDGGMLLAMKNMMEKTYEKYNNNLEIKFQMSLTDILKFDSALSSLKI